MNKPVFTVVIPFYHNAESIPHTIPRLISVAKKITEYDVEFVFIEDGSKDNTYNILAKHTEKIDIPFKLIKLTRNFGQISAIRAGLKNASGSIIGIISADLQDPPEMFHDMLKHWEQGAKLVLAERSDRDEGIIQKVFSNLYWKMVKYFAIPNYPTGGFDFCIIDRQIADCINQMPEKNTQIFPLIFSLGFPYQILPYIRARREHGKSQWTTTMKIKLFLDTFIAFSYLPIRLISLLGASIAILTFIYGSLMAANYFIYGNKITGWTTVVLLLSIIGGLTLLTLGLIGEYLWRILDQVRNRPLYVIEKITHQ